MNIAFYKNSGCHYIKNFVGNDIKNEVKEELLNLEWETQRTARHEYFMSETPREYTYGGGGGDKTYFSKEFSGKVAVLKEMLNSILTTRFNVCFLNKYDNHLQHLGWHTDNFPGMDKTQPIAVVSFGAEREIWVKEKSFKGLIPADQRILLEDGSLFVMPPKFQDNNLHRIPKCYHPCDWRISLTFRKFN